MSKTVEVKITASIVTEIELEKGETVQDVKNRWVDIYLHGAGDDGSANKVDLGCDEHSVKVLRIVEES